MKRSDQIKVRSTAVRAPGRRLTAATSISAAVAAILWGAGGAAVAQTANPGTAPTATSADESTLETIIVTGTTSKRTLLNSSVDVTLASEADLAQKAPRSTVDILELVPGIFVEGTAGPVSNNYSVRGLPGGGQQFIMLQEDGMPVIYSGNGDEWFQYDLNTERVEAIEGGPSGVLSVNGAGATINFISRPLSYDKAAGLGRISATTYGDKRADLYYSAPITSDVAYSIGGYVDSSPGVRDSPFTYQTYHFKGQIEKKFDSGANIKFGYKRWDEHDAYYADQPYALNNGQIAGIPGLGTQHGNITGYGFAGIYVPSTCSNAACTSTNLRLFSSAAGIHETGNQYRLDVNVPVNDNWSGFLKARYIEGAFDFNGIFPGSAGNGSLQSADAYLNGGANSPISSLLALGPLASFPGATHYGIENMTTGQVLGGTNLAGLNALNGNGLLQQTVLNHGTNHIADFGSDFGVKFKHSGSAYNNSLTVGAMVWHAFYSNDQSGTTTLLNDVKNSSSIYNVVALNATGGVVGTLTNNGLLSYGDWGSGISNASMHSLSGYFNDDLALLEDKLHVDFGVRKEVYTNNNRNGNAGVTPIPAEIGGVVRTTNNAFNGTYGRDSRTVNPTSWTLGANYKLSPTLAVYARYASGNNLGGTGLPTYVLLYEAGVRYGGHGFVASATLFHTGFNDQGHGFIDPTNPLASAGFNADTKTNGIDISADWRPSVDGALHSFKINLEGTYQQPKLSNLRAQDPMNQGLVDKANGNVPERTPQLLYSVTPSIDLPGHRGQLYARYKFVGKIFADSGNGLALPSYGVLSLGGNFDISERLNVNVSVDNVNDVVGLTEGNPRDRINQSAASGYFYGRGIIGTNALMSITYKF